jgi:predicted nucleotidyltransferase
MTGLNINAVRRELGNLEEFGLLKSSVQGNMKVYAVDRSMAIWEELTSIVLKTEGIAREIKEHLDEIGSIKWAFIYGSYARNEARINSDIDLFIVGDVDEDQLLTHIRAVEAQLSREVHYVLFTDEEFKNRVDSGDSFVSNVLIEPRIAVVGDLP